MGLNLGANAIFQQQLAHLLAPIEKYFQADALTYVGPILTGPMIGSKIP